MIVKASNDTGTCYGVAKCAEIVFERGKMVKGEDRKDSEKWRFLNAEWKNENHEREWDLQVLMSRASWRD